MGGSLFTLSLHSDSIMSDEEYEYGDEEYEEEEVGKNTTAESEGEELLRARNETKKAELNEQLKEVINDWRKNRAKEEEELQKLKELQARRKEIRAEQELKLAEQKREEEERIRREEAEKKAKEIEEKRQRKKYRMESATENKIAKMVWRKTRKKDWGTFHSR